MAKWQKDECSDITHLWKMYEDGIDYQHKIGIRYNIPKYVDFYEGRQWPAPTESTKNLPRPVVNIVKMICRSKKSSILSMPVRIYYKSYSQSTDVEKLNSFAEYIQKDMNQDGLDRLALDDGIKKGSYFYHYYWDSRALGMSGRIEGGVRCEIIDPLNIFFSNPRELDEQKQKWILISTQVEPNTVFELCDPQVDLGAISRDCQGGENEKRTVTLLTRYFRIDGEVYCERGTKTCIVNAPFKLSLDRNELKASLFGANCGDNEHFAHQCLPNDTQAHKGKSKESAFIYDYTRRKSPKATLYPIVCGYYERREGSIYGISEVEGIIPNQKAINFNIAMSLLNAQQCAWGKYIALPNALNGQCISNSPGQVLIDYSGTGNGIKKMSEESLSKAPLDLVDMITQLTRTSTGSSEIISGEALSSNLSGVAIAQLQAQAEVPIEDLRSTFWEAKKKQGKVLAQFIRLNYYDKEFIRSAKDKEGKTCEICDRFFSEDYANSVFDVVVEPTKGTRASISSDVNMLDTCLKHGKISIETYIKAYPEGAISNKYAILRQLEDEKSQEITKLRKELEAYKNGKTPNEVSEI